MSDLNPTLSIIPLNMNGKNISNRRQRMSDYLKRQHATLCFLWDALEIQSDKLIGKG